MVTGSFWLQLLESMLLRVTLLVYGASVQQVTDTTLKWSINMPEEGARYVCMHTYIGCSVSDLFHCVNYLGPFKKM